MPRLRGPGKTEIDMMEASVGINREASRLREVLKDILEIVMEDWNKMCPICVRWVHAEDCEAIGVMR